MFDSIPILLYTPIYFYLLLFVVLVTLVHTQAEIFGSDANKSFANEIGFFLFIAVVLYIGLRPIHGIFVDMHIYNNIFKGYAYGAEITDKNDLLFHFFTRISAQIMTSQMYFFLCACLYVIPLYYVCKKWFKEYWFYGFLFFVASLTFWNYGVNTMRNGIAGSLFLLGISREKRLWQIVLILLAVNFHKTMLLPTIGFAFANVYNQPKRMMAFWLLCIPLSLIAGGTFEAFFGGVGFDDSRMSYLTDQPEPGRFSKTGFRWDFVIYSAIAVFVGWYYIVKREYKDKIYFLLFNTYLFSNGIWILVIRANFSDRFAYLSWFMMALIIIYPLLKVKLFDDQHKSIGVVLAVYFGFTFLMNVLLQPQL